MVGLGIDFTARDVQNELKEKGLPWEKAKGFDGAAVVSHEFLPLKDLGGEIQNLKFELKKNGRVVQTGDTSEMMFSVDDLIVYLSKYMTLKTGDLIFTGTPAGVGSVKKGDLLTGALEGNHLFDVRVR
jgi:2-keto-4-pentenoate hydratase/2-oxohepta-3-ene-1,7-dioic acid hydratase in catechol pathway